MNTDELIALGLIDPPTAHNAPSTGSAQAAQGGEGEGEDEPDEPQPASRTSSQPTPGFIKPEWYGKLRWALTNRKGASLFGGRGGGKSTAIRQLAKELGAGTITMQCAHNMQVSDMLGSYGEGLKYTLGELAVAVRDGLWCLAEEANMIHPGVWSKANTLTDGTGEGLRLPTGELIPNHPNFRLILLFNDGYTGSREVNPALKDRLPPIFCPYPQRDAEIEILRLMTGADDATLGRVRDVAEMVRAANLRFDLSVRALANWIQYCQSEGASWTDGYEFTIMDLVGTDETAGPQRAALKTIRENSVDTWTV